ncbi:DMT family transporter [Paracoccus zhejiangensis]|nr:DMT family transporter [Paracoccus zhejiangensis]
MPLVTLGLLIAAGAALVAQNLLMARITGSVSTVLIALVMNSAVGLVLLSLLLLRKAGIGGIGEIVTAFRPWFLIPGLLGSYFVFASITGYQRLGAAPTIAILVASQLVIGLAWDLTRSGNLTLQGILTAALGASLLVAGVVIILSLYR